MPQLKSIKYLLIAASCLSITYGAVMSQIGDVEVIINESKWICDKITCPPETDHCRVTKQKPIPDANKLTRTNTCYSRDNKVLNQFIRCEPIGAAKSTSLDITATRSGITSNSNSGSYTNGGNYGSLIISGNPGVNSGNSGSYYTNVGNGGSMISSWNSFGKPGQTIFNNRPILGSGNNMQIVQQGIDNGNNQVQMVIS